MSIHEKAMLVNLSISQWGMRKYDKKISNEIERKYNAIDAGRYNKVLIAIEEGKKIEKVATEIYVYNRVNTLPWKDEGHRILPSANFFEYTTKMNDKKIKFWDSVQAFLSNYETYKEEARIRLNGMFNESDYPNLEVLKSKYKIDISFYPIPDSGDFRVNLRDDEVDRIKVDIEQTVKKAEQDAVNDLWSRLYKAVEHIIERLSDKDNKFKDTLIGNVIELADLLPRLNFTNDSKLDEMIKDLNQSICVISPENIRKDAKLRKETADKAKDLIKKMEFYG
ncbi:MAG: hypothetical protein ACW96U_00805 [Candidatus Heimdallarchaeaceae archaeon]|jgi:hypothetical protein